jgi:hypothetical protein
VDSVPDPLLMKYLQYKKIIVFCYVVNSIDVLLEVTMYHASGFCGVF